MDLPGNVLTIGYIPLYTEKKNFFVFVVLGGGEHTHYAKQFSCSNGPAERLQPHQTLQKHADFT